MIDHNLSLSLSLSLSLYIYIYIYIYTLTHNPNQQKNCSKNFIYWLAPIKGAVHLKLCFRVEPLYRPKYRYMPRLIEGHEKKQRKTQNGG